jgi:hypothetical protein
MFTPMIIHNYQPNNKQTLVQNITNKIAPYVDANFGTRLKKQMFSLFLHV